METDESSSADDSEDDHDDDALEQEQQNDHFAFPVNEPPDEELANADELHDENVEQVNVIADDSGEDNDVIENTTRSEDQRQERSQRRRSRRNNSSSSTGAVRQKSRMESNLESKPLAILDFGCTIPVLDDELFLRDRRLCDLSCR